MTECSFPGCGRDIYAKGICTAHYTQRIRGRDLTPIRPKRTPLQRIAASVVEEGGCLVWQGPTVQGYGTVFSDGNRVRAHRYVYALTHGPIPVDMVVDHICRNRRCVNVDHLRLVTRAQNSQNRALRRPDGGFRGVTFHRRVGKWQARVGLDYRRVSLGYFDSEQEAADAVVAARLRLHTHNDEDRKEKN